MAESVKQLSLRLTSLNINRPENPAPAGAQKRHSMIPFSTGGGPKDALKRAASTRARRLSQFLNLSDADPAPVVETTTRTRPKRRPDMEINIVVLGDAGVGKSQLLRWVSPPWDSLRPRRGSKFTNPRMAVVGPRRMSSW